MTSPRVSAAAPESAAPPLFGRPLAAPLLFGLLGALVSALGSWNVSIWTDEAATISASDRTLPEVWALLGQLDAVHGAYYLLMHFWSAVFGYSPFALRLPSAFAAGVAVAGAVVLARRLGGERMAMVAGIVAVVLPRITWMGIEARSFGFSAALAVWATVALLAALKRGRWFWLAYSGLLAAGIALNIYVAMIALAHGLTVLLLAPGGLRRRLEWVGAAALGGLISSPVVLVSATQQGQLSDAPLRPSAVFRQVFVNQWFLGETPTRVSSTNDGFALWAVSAVALAALCWLLVVLAVASAFRRTPDGAGDRFAVLLLLAWMLVPTILVVVYSLVSSPLYNPRYFTFAAPAVAVVVALGITRLRRRSLRIVALALIVALAAPVYLSQRGETGKSGTDWSQVATYMGDNARPGDGVYFAPLNPPPGPLYGRNTRNIETAYPGAFTGLTDLTLYSTGIEDTSLRGLSRTLAASTDRLAGVDRVWVVRPTDYPAELSVPDDEVFATAGFTVRSTWTGPMDEVLEYVRG